MTKNTGSIPYFFLADKKKAVFRSSMIDLKTF
jgi:hypothetical protein